MRVIGCAVAFLVASFAGAQNLPPDGKCVWTIGEQGETTRTVVEASWTFVKGATKTISRDAFLTCGGYCIGEKHLVHEQCDRSCDVPCYGQHRYELKPYFDYPSDGGGLDKALRQFGVTGDPSPIRCGVIAGTRALAHIPECEDDPENLFSFSFPCWNDQPCTFRYKSYDLVSVTCNVTYSLQRRTTMPDGSTTVTQGPVVPESYNASFALSSSIKNIAAATTLCRCSILSEGRDEFGKLIIGDLGIGLACVHDGENHGLDGKQIAGLGLTVVGQSMNSFTVAVSNRPPDCDRLFIPAGWEFRCDDGSAQDTLLVQDAEITFADASNVGTLTVNASPWRPWDVFTTAAAELRTMCLNIKKREPEPGKKYTLQPPSRPETIELARMTRDSRFKGPWDQTRLWIVTDRASLDEVNKVLLPGPTPRMYLRELWTVTTKGLFALDPVKDAKVTDNRLFVSAAPDQEPLHWFVAWKLAHDKEKSLAWIRSHAKSFAELFKDGKEDEAAEGVAMLAGDLSSLGGDDGARTAADLLLDPALSEYRGIVANDSHSGTVIAPLTWTKDPATANRILDYIEACNPAAGVMACRNVAPWLPQDVKDRATKLIGLLENRERH